MGGAGDSKMPSLHCVTFFRFQLGSLSWEWQPRAKIHPSVSAGERGSIAGPGRELQSGWNGLQGGRGGEYAAALCPLFGLHSALAPPTAAFPPSLTGPLDFGALDPVIGVSDCTFSWETSEGQGRAQLTPGKLPTERCSNVLENQKQVRQDAWVSARYDLPLAEVLGLRKNSNYDVPGWGKKTHLQEPIGQLTANCGTQITNVPLWQLEMQPACTACRHEFPQPEPPRDVLQE